jgi:hypothetical protein
MMRKAAAAAAAAAAAELETLKRCTPKSRSSKTETHIYFQQYSGFEPRTKCN